MATMITLQYQQNQKRKADGKSRIFSEIIRRATWQGIRVQKKKKEGGGGKKVRRARRQNPEKGKRHLAFDSLKKTQCNRALGKKLERKSS